MLVTGHPDGTVRMPVPNRTRRRLRTRCCSLEDAASGNPHTAIEMVVEIKTRGPEAFRRWRTLGAERSHPASVAQAAFYTLGRATGTFATR